MPAPTSSVFTCFLLPEREQCGCQANDLNYMDVCHTLGRITHVLTDKNNIIVYQESQSFKAKIVYVKINPLSPHDALKHHFTSLKTYLIFLQPKVLERKFP